MIEKDKEYIGLVKWFGNKQTEENYGFIYSPDIDDIYVNQQAAKFEINAMDIVFFKVRELNEDREIAYSLKKIDEEVYLPKLLECYLNWKMDSDLKNNVQIKLFSVSQNSDLFLAAPMLNMIDQFIENKLISYINSKNVVHSKLNETYSPVKGLFTELKKDKYIYETVSVSKNLIKYFTETSNRYVRLLGWLENVLSYYEWNLVRVIYEISDICIRKNIIRKINQQHFDELLDISISTFEEKAYHKPPPLKEFNKFQSLELMNISSFVKVIQSKDQESGKKYLIGIFPKCSSHVKLELCLDYDYLEFSEDVQKLIIEKFNEFDDYKLSMILNRFISLDEEILKKIIQKLSSLQQDSVYGKNLKEMLSRWKGTGFNAYCSTIINALSFNKKMELWIEGYLDYLDLDEITKNFHELSEYYQETTIKKVLFYFNDRTRDKIELFVDTILKKLQESSKDFTVLLSLNLINAKIKGNKINLNPLIVQSLQLIHTNKIKEISTFGSIELLEKCRGRGIVSYYDGQATFSKSSNIPEGIIYCEGRKAINKETNKSILHERSEFHWCKNKHCYQNEINKRRPGNTFIKYSQRINGSTWDEGRLYEILKRINKNYTEDEHSYSLGIINKFYQYLKHLKCRSCDSWLTPIVQSNFGYDRVNRFKCEKNGCDQNGKEIYISHCLNYRCNNVVDSRNSKQCSHGWYICDYCLSCCSTEKLQVRKDIRIKTNQGYSGPEKGHDELEKIFCHRCGDELTIKNNLVNPQKIEEIINSLYSDNIFEVLSNGVRKNGIKWLLVKPTNYNERQKAYNKLKILETEGFIFTENQSGDGFFINEPLSQNFHSLTCQNSECKFTLYLEAIYSSDKEKFNALKYHKKIELLFSKVENNYE